ncbi:alpha/beta hydrolase family protein [Rhodococcus sovatensis]|uniref:Alpha/beta hydrolase n=1 Tax=Rhodococcus sovatensis TaxID=1805840 RepID=A0ABZ2PJU4_9NOCA
MATLIEWGQRAAVSARALTRTTERGAHSRGVAPFLPRLFVDRFTHLGGIPDAEFRAQLAQCRSFEDHTWAPYWSTFATEQLERADAALSRLGAPTSPRLFDARDDTILAELGAALAPAAPILADRGTVADPRATAQFIAEHPEASDAAVAIDGLIKALVYYFVAAWPGWTPQRNDAYRRSTRLSESLLLALAPTMGYVVEVVDIALPGTSDRVHGILALPLESKPIPTVLVTNGLEGTIAETLLPLLAQRDSGLGTFVMEMPGTYSYDDPMTAASEEVYSAVVDFLSADERIDADRIGMMGFSFGGYWSARMAASDSRLKVAVCNGPLTHRSFGVLISIGMPEDGLDNDPDTRRNRDCGPGAQDIDTVVATSLPQHRDSAAGDQRGRRHVGQHPRLDRTRRRRTERPTGAVRRRRPLRDGQRRTLVCTVDPLPPRTPTRSVTRALTRKTPAPPKHGHGCASRATNTSVSDPGECSGTERHIFAGPRVSSWRRPGLVRYR